MKKSAPTFILLFGLLLLLPAGLLAEDDLRTVQEELRRRSLYFGDVNGRDSAELHEATRRYQKRKGFAATGKADQETLKSLGLVPRSASEPAAKELDWPEEPVLPSDERINPVAVAKALSEETGIASAVIVPAAATRRSRKKEVASSTPLPVVTAEQRGANSPNIAPSELSRFVADYLKAMGSSDIKRQMKFYADNVEYYRNGKIDRRIVEQSLRRYQARWPNRRYTMGPEIQYGPINSRGEIMITFPLSFTLKDGRRTVKGQTTNRLSILAATLDPRIASISEQRVRR